MALLFACGLAETGLRLGLRHLPLPLADALATGYVDFGDGIYRFDPLFNMDRMRPHYERRMFFNGYVWNHRTDWMGFRNPADRTHDDVALIGDSMIYGHGLEETATVRSRLEGILGATVANLGIQGGAMDNEYEILRHDAVRLSPHWVLIFFLNNDLTDLGRLDDDELQRFIALPVADHTSRYFHPRPAPRSLLGGFDWRDFYLVRGYLFFANRIGPLLHRRHHARSTPGRTSLAADSAVEAGTSGWVNEAPFAGNPRMQLAMRFHLRAILKADDFARRHHMHFAYVFLAVPLPFDMLYEAIIADFCHTHGIDFFSLRATYSSAQRAGVAVYLPRDGHLSAAGARLTAEALANHFPLRAP